MFIYLIENNINNKIYIGKTKYKNPTQRWSSHKCSAKKNSRYPISSAISKYGYENFSFIPFKWCDNNEQLEQEEIYWIAQVRLFLGRENVYNISDGGDGGRYLKGRKLSEAHKKKISESAKKSINAGRFSKNHAVPEKWKKITSEANKSRDYSYMKSLIREKNKASFKKGNVPWNKGKVSK